MESGSTRSLRFSLKSISLSRNQSYPNKKSRNQAQNAETAAESSAAAIHAEDEDDAIALVADVDDNLSDVTLAPIDTLDDDLEYYNFDENQSEDRLIYYEWLADTAATSHITNRRDAFITYESIPAITIGRVGGMKTRAIGRGDINLRSKCDGQPYLLKLRNVLHVPENKNNLFSLGRWEKDGRSIYVNDGVIALHMRNGIIAAKGHKIHNNLYKICFAISPASATITCAFIADDNLPTWENWHRQFAHVNYRGIKKLLDANMVEGLQINSSSPKPDCIEGGNWGRDGNVSRRGRVGGRE